MNSQESIQLRPRTLGELLDQAIRLYRNNFLTYIGIIGLMQIPLTILSLLVSFSMMDSTIAQMGGDYTQLDTISMLAGYGGSILISIVSFILINGVATAALTQAIADNYLGEKTDIFSAFKKVGKSWRPLIGSLLILGMVTIGISIWTMIPILGWFTGPGILIFLSMLVSSLIPPSVVLEKRSASNAYSRAMSLSLKRFWWLLGYMAILTGLSYVIVSAPSSLLSYFTRARLVESLNQGITSAYIWQLILQSLLSMILSLLFTPLRLTGVILAYFDLRVRFEGFDLAVLAHQMEEKDSTAENITGLALETEQEERFFTTQNLGRFIALTLLALIPIIIIFGITIFSALQSF